MPMKSVTFDLDGTLVDTVADLAEACRRMLEELGEPPRSIDEIHCFVGKGTAVLVERCLTHGQPPSAEHLRAGIQAFHRHYAEVNGRMAQVYPGVLHGLADFAAAGLKMAIVTNKPGEFTEYLLERLDLLEHFDAIVSGDTTAHRKPHPEPILHACRIMGTRPVENLHVGDSKTDIQAARAAGCPVFCVPYGYNEGEPVDSADCDALVSDLVAACARLKTICNSAKT